MSGDVVEVTGSGVFARTLATALGYAVVVVGVAPGVAALGVLAWGAR